MGLQDTISKLSNLENAITNALENEVANAAVEEIQQTMDENVYQAYAPTPIFAQSRRKDSGGLRDKNNLSVFVSGDTLTIESVAGLQNLFGGDRSENLASIVQSGNAAFPQPFPRPFMEEAKQRFISSGQAEAALLAGLRRQGIDTNGLSFSFE